ncbi:MAG: cell division protein ZipA C-terminal FtsZ-binding domain-containing protein [Pseudomonadota bacterium]
MRSPVPGWPALLPTAMLLCCSHAEESQLARDDEFSVVPEGESQARAGALLSQQGSEEASHIARALTSRGAEPEEPVEHGPSPDAHWSIGATLTEPLLLTALTSAWPPERRKACGMPTFFGRERATGRLTCAIADDVEGPFTEVVAAWDYVRFDADAPLSEDAVRRNLACVTAWYTTLGRVEIGATPAPAEVAARSRALHGLRASADIYTAVVLVAPQGRPFPGRDVWDVMMSAGLHWGDMDCFHLRNSSGIGGDSWFSVETSTPPGYFFPEEVAAGRMNPEDLVFAFSVPRNADPLATLDVMVAVVNYAQRRLGGVVVDARGQPLDLAAEHARIQSALDRLAAAGLGPGRDGTLRIF